MPLFSEEGGGISGQKRRAGVENPIGGCSLYC